MNTRMIVLMAATVLGATSALAAAAEGKADRAAVESVTVKNGVLIATIDGRPVEATNEITFPKNIVIGTNGHFKVGAGKARALAEGQILARDGRLTSSDGSIVPVKDHVTVKRGRVLVVRDGEPQALRTMLQLPNGTRIHPDGRMVTARNATRRLLDGQIVDLNDASIEATDSARLEKGKVVLFKDGGRIELRATQVMSMSDGSRIDGRGFVVKPDGSRVSLHEGELYKFAGAGDSR